MLNREQSSFIIGRTYWKMAALWFPRLARSKVERGFVPDSQDEGLLIRVGLLGGQGGFDETIAKKVGFGNGSMARNSPQ